MSKLKVDSLLVFSIFDILILSHNKEGMSINMRKDITVEKIIFIIK